MATETYTTTEDFQTWLNGRGYSNALKLPYNDCFVGTQDRVIYWDLGNNQEEDTITDESGSNNEGEDTLGALVEEGLYYDQHGDFDAGIANASVSAFPSGAFSVIVLSKQIFTSAWPRLFTLGSADFGINCLSAGGTRYSIFRDTNGTSRTFTGTPGGVSNDTWYIFAAVYENDDTAPVCYLNGAAYGGTPADGSGTDDVLAASVQVLGSGGSDNLECTLNQIHFIDGIIDADDIDAVMIDVTEMSSPVVDTGASGEIFDSATCTVQTMPTNASYRVRARASNTSFTQEAVSPSWSEWSAAQTTTQTISISGVSGQYQQIQIEGTPTDVGIQETGPEFSSVSFSHSSSSGSVVPQLTFVQTDNFTTRQEIKRRFIDIKPTPVTPENPSIPQSVDTHLETHYQLWEGQLPVSGPPTINIRSGATGQLGGTIVNLSKTSLQIILKPNTAYKCRVRFRGDSGWAAWTAVENFRTRDLDYKYIRGGSSNPTNLTTETKTPRGATIVNNSSNVIESSSSTGIIITNPNSIP